MRQDALIQTVAAAESGAPRYIGRALRELAQPTIYTGTATAGAATVNGRVVKITTESLTTAQSGIYTLTVTNDQVAASDVVLASVANGSNTQGTPIIGRVTPGNGSVVVQVINQHASAQALNGTLVVSLVVIS